MVQLIVSVFNDERIYRTYELQNECDPERRKSSACNPRTEVRTEWYYDYGKENKER